jgi:hypothetical protein
MRLIQHIGKIVSTAAFFGEVSMATSVRGFKDASDRWLYWPAAVAIGVVVVWGFSESYFLRPFVAQADSLTTLVHVHGALMTSWIALFIAQTTLVAIGRRDLHRRLGALGMVLVARLHPAFLWGALFLFAMQGFSLWISNTSIWLRIAHGILQASE